MKLIVAGLGRSGTTSPRHAHLNAVARGKMELNPAVLEGVGATVGWPLCWTVAQQMACFPEAKVLLNKRNPEAWLDSMQRALKTLGVVRRLRWLPKLRHINETMDLLFEQMGSERPSEAWVAGYNGHLDTIRALVPAEELLEYEVHEGWEPLCAFLGLPVPTEPFPKENVGGGESLREKLQKLFGIGGEAQDETN